MVQKETTVFKDIFSVQPNETNLNTLGTGYFICSRIFTQLSTFYDTGIYYSWTHEDELHN